ncbi:MAG TPA: hypothetical protein VJ739_11570 [Gemmataceae bacterium]|nr:hypothetical protein [Gemmataceae bacterium]
MTAEETDPDLGRVWSSLEHSRHLLHRSPRRSRDNAWLAIASAFRLAEQHAQEEWERRMPELDGVNHEELFLQCLDEGIERLKAIRQQLQDIHEGLPPRDDV